MAKLAWALICQRAIVDQATNNVTLVDVLEQVTVPPPPEDLDLNKTRPLIPVRFWVVTMWERSDASTPEAIACRLKFFSPDGKQFGATPETRVDMTVGSRYRVMSEAPGFPFFGPGRYECRVEQRVGKTWRRVGTTGFDLGHSPTLQ